MADSAQGLIRSTLDRYGLGSLADWAWALYKLGNSMEEILLEMRTTKEYKTRFPAMEQLAKEGRAMSEEAVIQYETGLLNMVTRFGLPRELYASRGYVTQLLLKGVALPEVQSRMELAQAASVTAPLEFRMAVNRLYGVSAGQLTSFWLETDRTLPLLEKQFASATIAAETTMANLGDLSRTMAERLVEAGIGREQARQGLTRASYELTAKLPGEAEAGLGADIVAAGVLGVGQERNAFERRLRQRLAAFAGGGGAITTEKGATGLTTTRR
jgi:hypothetical protein